MAVENQVEGRHEVMAALKAGRRIRRLYVQRGTGLGEIIAAARVAGVAWQEVDRGALDRMAGSGAHQGVIAVVEPYEYVEVETIVAVAARRGRPPLIVALDSLEDPHNLGSVLRTVDAAGADGVIIPERRAVGLTPAAVKAAAGAAERVPVAKVTNLARTLDQLKEAGLWIYGADADGTTPYFDTDLTGPLVLVVGGEGHGLGRLVKEKCDYLLRIPMVGETPSLNAGVAAAILLYEVVRQRWRGTEDGDGRRQAKTIEEGHPTGGDGR